ncbi:hypothetical protein D3C77_728110 [compost metagenome]
MGINFAQSTLQTRYAVVVTVLLSLLDLIFDRCTLGVTVVSRISHGREAGAQNQNQWQNR